MLKNIILIAVVYRLSDARPKTAEPLNLAAVPPNCKDGQEWVNGQCRDIWRRVWEVQNVASALPNCQPGQQYINGQCRDIWFAGNQQNFVPEDSLLDQKNVVTVPPNCPPGQEWINGACREIWRTNGFQPANVITVPPNCPSGQEYINGQCREIWARLNPTENVDQEDSLLDQKNVVTVPRNCPPGQEWINGACREIWRTNGFQPANVITVPPNCPSGQEYINGQCREIWARLNPTENVDQEDSLLDQKNVVTVPPNCPPGQEWINGACHEIWRSNGFHPANVITVPPNCPSGQEYVNGQCREIWVRLNPTENIGNAKAKTLHQPNFLGKIVAVIQNELSDRSVDTTKAAPHNQQSGKNIISIPNQCPDGYRPDANGVCREVWTRVVPTTM